MPRLRQSNPLAWVPLSRAVLCLAAVGLVAACSGQKHVSRSAGEYAARAKGDYAPPGPPGDPWGPYITKAAARFDVPERWIREVMRVESSGQMYQGGKLTTSHAGAMGLMQVMPQTYAELRGRYGLGADPYQPRDNILAGAAYLREMYDRFGAGGFLAAYNAGPARYEQHLIDGRPLPLETRAYVAKLTTAVGGAVLSAGSMPLPSATAAPRPTLFVAIGTDQGIDAGPAPQGAPAVLSPAQSPLFAALSPRTEAR